jgi:hypothetical protein
MTIKIPTNYRWPRSGDRLLRAENDWQRGIVFEERDIARYVHIWEGYMKAGATLIEECQRSNSRLDRHELVYPILFCYRHGLELAMKWIIAQYGRYANIPSERYQHHDLRALWIVCKKVILEVGSDKENDALLAVEQIVGDFDDLDHGSFSFRYSTDKKGMVNRLPKDPFDLANIRDVMEGGDNLFTGADGQLHDNSQNVPWDDGAI